MSVFLACAKLKFILETEKAKRHDAPWLKNANSVYRNASGRFSSATATMHEATQKSLAEVGNMFDVPAPTKETLMQPLNKLGETIQQQYQEFEKFIEEPGMGQKIADAIIANAVPFGTAALLIAGPEVLISMILGEALIPAIAAAAASFTGVAVSDTLLKKVNIDNPWVRGGINLLVGMFTGAMAINLLKPIERKGLQHLYPKLAERVLSGQSGLTFTAKAIKEPAKDAIAKASKEANKLPEAERQAAKAALTRIQDMFTRLEKVGIEAPNKVRAAQQAGRGNRNSIFNPKTGKGMGSRSPQPDVDPELFNLIKEFDKGISTGFNEMFGGKGMFQALDDEAIKDLTREIQKETQEALKIAQDASKNPEVLKMLEDASKAGTRKINTIPGVSGQIKFNPMNSNDLTSHLDDFAKQTGKGDDLAALMSEALEQTMGIKVDLPEALKQVGVEGLIDQAHSGKLAPKDIKKLKQAGIDFF